MPDLGTIEKLQPAPQNRRWIDLAVGIALGVALGMVVICAFLFLGSEGSIDAPRISGVDTGKPVQNAAAGPKSKTTGERQPP